MGQTQENIVLTQKTGAVCVNIMVASRGMNLYCDL
jgi:hypothetical protein